MSFDLWLSYVAVAGLAQQTVFWFFLGTSLNAPNVLAILCHKLP